MTYFLKQDFLTWGERFAVTDESARNRYFVESELFAVGKVLRLLTLGGNQIAEIKQKVWSLTPTFAISRDGKDPIALSMGQKACRAKKEGILIEGDLHAHTYRIKAQDGSNLATVAPGWFNLGQGFRIDIEGNDPELILALVLTVEAWQDKSDKHKD